MTQSLTLYWHRLDLRLADNPALCAAAAKGAVVPVYILPDANDTRWAMGGASRWWLHHALTDLTASYAKHGVKLILRRGEPLRVLQELIAETGAKVVMWNRCYEPASIKRDSHIKEALQQQGLEVTSHKSSLLFEPWEIKNKAGEFFKVYTPFSKTCYATANIADSLPVPKITPYSGVLRSDQLAAWALLPTQPDWSGGMQAFWQVGEQAAHQRLRDFIGLALSGYKERRNNPDADTTSRLSPYLAFGQISPRQIWHAIQYIIAEGKYPAADTGHFLNELLWREFSYHLLYHFPALPEQPMNAAFAAFPWEADAGLLRRWQRGETGYPIVDAGMRQLWQTGWMHNRVRMIVASFLVKDLRIPWQAGEAWFWDTLVDADLANNSASWQWVAGCGADAAPYFRIFNPVLQGQKFDPKGDYVRHYVPELAALPAEIIHAPWTASPDILAKAGVKLGKNYPEPMVDHAKARDLAMAAYQKIKKT